MLAMEYLHAGHNLGTLAIDRPSQRPVMPERRDFFLSYRLTLVIGWAAAFYWAAVLTSRF